jgi:putative transposase
VAPIAVVSDKGPCFRSETFAQTFTGHDPLLRHVRTRVRSPQANGVIERFFGTLKYEHLYRGVITDCDALSVEVSWFRQIYNTIRPHQVLRDRTPKQVYFRLWAATEPILDSVCRAAMKIRRGLVNVFVTACLTARAS